MAKKALHIIFSVLLLISTIGITISKHYSGGKLFSFAFWADADKCCEIPCDCCSDETSYLHLDTDYLQTSNLELQQRPDLELPVADLFFWVNLFMNPVMSNPAGYFWDISPPQNSRPPAFLQVFRC